MKDKSGTEITMGARVSHTYDVYNRVGVIVGFTRFCVEVEPAWSAEKQCTSLHCPGLLTVVPATVNAEEEAA